MTTQPSDSSEAKDSTKYKLGDLVRATKTIFAAATDELPAQDFCNAGDTLEIRKIAGFWPYSVAHPNGEAGVMFGVNEDEVEPLSDRPPAAAPRSEPLDAASHWWQTKITVCDKCFQATCWQGVFMCDESQNAGTVDKTIAELIALNTGEHPDHWTTTPAAIDALPPATTGQQTADGFKVHITERKPGPLTDDELKELKSRVSWPFEPTPRPEAQGTPTPLTDAEETDPSLENGYVTSFFARQLETELAAMARAINEALKINREVNKLPMGNFYLAETMEGFLALSPSTKSDVPYSSCTCGIFRDTQCPKHGDVEVFEKQNRDYSEEKEIDRLIAELTAERAARQKAESALSKINVIRNSIVAFQSINWSEHIYPLVAALNEAGVEGMHYPEALAYFGSMLERTNKAESERDALQAKLTEVETDKARLDWIEEGPVFVDLRHRPSGKSRLSYSSQHSKLTLRSAIDAAMEAAKAVAHKP